MLTIPVKLSDNELFLVLILQKENIARMREADPIDLNTRDYFGNETGRIELLIAYEEDEAKLRELQERGDLKEIVTWLERGRTVYAGEPFKPRKWLSPQSGKETR